MLSLPDLSKMIQMCEKSYAGAALTAVNLNCLTHFVLFLTDIPSISNVVRVFFS